MMQEPVDDISCITSGGSLRQWLEKVRMEMQFVDISSRNAKDDFLAYVYRRPFASAELMRVDVPNLRQRRTSSDVAQDNCSDIQICYVADGEVEYRQYGRESFMRTHDCFLIDHGSPYELSTSHRSQSFGVRIPRTWVDRHLGPEEIAAQRIDGSSCWGAALSSYLRALYTDFGSAPSMSPSLMIEQALHLVELSMGEQLSGGSTHRKALLRRTRAAMRESFHDEELTPAKVAAMVGLSKGYMHRLFARAGTTFCRELDILRIERAAALLEAKRHQDLTINEIGIRCGLPTAPHFVRKFRTLKGMTPSQYRQLRLQGRH